MYLLDDLKFFTNIDEIEIMINKLVKSSRYRKLACDIDETVKYKVLLRNREMFYNNIQNCFYNYNKNIYFKKLKLNNILK